MLPACEGTRVNQALQGNWGLLLKNLCTNLNLGAPLPRDAAWEWWWLGAWRLPRSHLRTMYNCLAPSYLSYLATLSSAVAGSSSHSAPCGAGRAPVGCGAEPAQRWGCACALAAAVTAAEAEASGVAGDARQIHWFKASVWAAVPALRARPRLRKAACSACTRLRLRPAPAAACATSPFVSPLNAVRV